VRLAAIGSPQSDNLPREKRPETGLLGLRAGLGLFANLRPVKIIPALIDASTLKREVIEGVDLLVVRELTGGVYFGTPKGRVEADGRVRGFNTMAYFDDEIDRIAKLVRNPRQFDVLLTSNLFGDILSDEAAMLSGSIGMLPSASLGSSGPGLFEPIHGSAPDIAGQDKANPMAMVLSAAMMLRVGLQQEAAATALEQAVERVLALGLRTGDLMAEGCTLVGCRAMGDQLLAALET
jgi:3-isopropylmalate dehydrogenase